MRESLGKVDSPNQIPLSSYPVANPNPIDVGSISRKGEPFLYIFDFHPSSADGPLKFTEEDVIAFAETVQDKNPLKAASSLEFPRIPKHLLFLYRKEVRKESCIWRTRGGWILSPWDPEYRAIYNLQIST